jgi:hypothetical protein
MQFKSTASTVLAVAATAFLSAGNAAVLPLEQFLDLHTPHGLGLQHRDKKPGGDKQHASKHSHQASADTDAGIGSSVAGVRVDSLPARGAAADKAVPLHAALLSGGHAALQVTAPPGQVAAPASISAVPLPGALWLFGSALLAFLGFSRRGRT